MPSLLLALLFACTPSAPKPTPAPAAPADKVAKTPGPRAKAKAKAKAKAMRAKAKARGGAAGKKVGAPGQMLGQLVLQTQGEGDAQKTRATLRTSWEGGRHTVLLGITAGSCSEVEPREVANGVKATWWSECVYKDMKADYAILVSSGMIVVQRAITKDEKTGEWTTVRRVPLADDAMLIAGEVPVEGTETEGMGEENIPDPTAPAVPAPSTEAAAPEPASTP